MFNLLFQTMNNAKGDLPKNLGNQTYKILLVDDSEDNRFLIREYLKNTGHEIIEAENGEAAVEKAKRGQFDVILMDMKMPVMDGYSATKQIRFWETLTRLPRIPIVALTAYAMEDEQEKSLACGCDLHLSKPVSKKDLLSVLDQI